MAKAKASTATPTPILPKALDSQLTKALGLVGSKHYAEAMEIFKALVGPAKEAGNIPLQRTLHNYLVVCEHRTSKAPKGATGPEGEAQWLLNKKDSEGALALLEKSIKAAPTNGILYFLKATAHAQLGDAEASAEALNRSMLLNGDLLHLYRLETDFDAVRNMAPFAAIERT
jgi:tetratricopeptide (TPR) repeat protein